MAENKNFLIAALLSVGVLLLWQYFIVDPRVEAERAQMEATQTVAGEQAPGTAPQGADGVPVPEGVGALSPIPGVDFSATGGLGRGMALAQSPRLSVETPKLAGSISLKGARFDDLLLKNYRVSVDETSPEIILFSPVGAKGAYFADFGWTAAPGGGGGQLPDQNTLWQVPSGAKLTPQTPVTLSYDNGAGLIFRQTVSVDEDYLFTVEQSVENTGASAVGLYPYGLVSRTGLPELEGIYILHEGLIGAFDPDGLQEHDYDDIAEDGVQKFSSDKGWVGITDKYWAAVLVPPQGSPFTARFSEHPDPRQEIYRADYLMDVVSVAPGATQTVKTQLFAGAKEVPVLDRYTSEFGFHQFDLLIDWGYLWFLTQPLFAALHFIALMVGNFGIGILAVTVLVKLAFFPLANKSYVAMSKMKKLQPEMMALRERYADDKVKQQQELMELYKKEKVNPLAGCLPMVIQIPVFFALYKVLYVTLEMRHAPFFGWIQDLSAPDPLNLFTLFGLIPWDPPSVMILGIWPIVMGFTMFVQMKMNPAPTDPIQQQVFAWMPLFFTFILASFPAGLVIYWAWNNTLSVLQQGVIMKRQGVKIEIFDNIGLKKLLGGRSGAGGDTK